MKLKKLLSVVLATLTAAATLCLCACGGGSKQSKVIDYQNIVWSCLGDSITDEYNGKKYPTVLRDTYAFRRVNNYAKSGATITTLNETNHLQQQIQRVDEASDIISVFAGVNDFLFYSAPMGEKGNLDVTTFYGAVESLIKGLQARCPDAYIFFITPYKCQWNDGRSYDKENKAGLILSDYVNAIIDLCKTYRLDYLNLYVDGGFDCKNPSHTEDGLHPLDSFQETSTSSKVGDFIRKNYPSFAKAKMKDTVPVDA